MLAHFVLVDKNPGQTLNQKGYHAKGKVRDAIECYEITAGPLAINVVGKDARLWAVMRSRKDSRTKEVVDTNLNLRFVNHTVSLR